MEEEETRFSLRVPNSLYAKLKDRAKNNRRSVNDEVLIIIERYIDAKEVIIPPKEESQPDTTTPGDNQGIKISRTEQKEILDLGNNPADNLKKVNNDNNR